VHGASVRLISLWVSQVARVLADWCLRLVAILEAAGAGRPLAGAWHLATAVFITPFIVLAPLNGCLSNGLPRRSVLAGTAAFALATVSAFALFGGPWIVCLGLVALAAAVYSPARYAMLPAAAADTKLPLPRVNGWIEMGGAASIVGGLALGWYLTGPTWPGDGLPLGGAVIGTLVGLNALCFLTALPLSFPSDVPRPETPARAVAGFFRDCGRILRDPVARWNVLGLAAFQAVVTGGSGALVAHALKREGAEQGDLLRAMTLVGVGAALGCLAAGLQGNLRRSPGLVPFGATGLLLALGWGTLALTGGGLPRVPCLLLGFMGGLVNVPLRAAYLAAVPADARGNGMSVMNTTIYVLTTVLALVLFGLTWVGGLLAEPFAQLGFLAVLTALGAVLAWWALLPNAVEQVLEWLLLPMSRVRAFGPGVDRIPVRGPLLLVANHAAYLDPFWLFKIMPRQPRPMMTSLYYDLPVVRWLMVHAIHAIRVEARGFRREAPELRQAVAALRQGDCVLIFPEAMLQRRAGQLPRPFGQGVWHILRELPQTPVVVCWIEGGWGSWSSYHNGPPMRNKPLDWRRPIDIGVAEPQVLDPAVLADQRATRVYLRRAVLECRRHLGLEVPDEAKQQDAEVAEEKAAERMKEEG
jgi:1-acyl-sn-glycerol-3-phosphate acyltransferase